MMSVGLTRSIFAAQDAIVSQAPIGNPSFVPCLSIICMDGSTSSITKASHP